MISPGWQPAGALQGQDTAWEKKGLLFPLCSLLHPSVLSMKLKAKGEGLYNAPLLGQHLSGAGAHARPEEEAKRKEASRQQL